MKSLSLFAALAALATASAASAAQVWVAPAAQKVRPSAQPDASDLRADYWTLLGTIPVRLDTRLEKLTWIPDARYRGGFFAAGGHRAVGWQIPQPWVTDADGARVRLDDVLGGQWAILHIGQWPSGSQAWAQLGVPIVPVSEPALIGWMRRRKVTAVVLRPDGFIYAAAGSGQPLPPPPPGHTGNVVTTKSKAGASA